MNGGWLMDTRIQLYWKNIFYIYKNMFYNTAGFTGLEINCKFQNSKEDS